MAEGVPEIGSGYGLVAGWPLRLRRRAVALIFAWKALSGAAFRRRTRRAPSVHLFQKVLRLPRREAVRLDRAAMLHDLQAEIEWMALHRRSLGGIRRDMARIAVEGAEILERVAASGRPVILAPLHMGAYVMGLAYTTLRFFPGRPLLILRRRDDMPMETRVMERIREFGVEMRFLKVDERADFLAAVRFAQKGAVIVVFCDLPPAYGAPASMPLFGLPTRFAFGVDALARLTGATVIPWVTIMQPGGDAIRIGRPFEVAGNTTEDREKGVAIIRGHLHAALSRYPQQWHLWPTLPDYLPEGGILPGDPADDRNGAFRSAA